MTDQKNNIPPEGLHAAAIATLLGITREAVRQRIKARQAACLIGNGRAVGRAIVYPPQDCAVILGAMPGEKPGEKGEQADIP